MRSKVFIVTVHALLVYLSPVLLVAQEDAQSAPQVTIEAIAVEPSSPAADTLCKLSVTLRNHGTEMATQLDFAVKINDQALPVYRNQIFMYPLPPGETAEVSLYNFWSTETSRPMPQDGKLQVEVTIAAAQWTKVSMEESTEVWAPLGPVPGLPHTRSITLEMKR